MRKLLLLMTLGLGLWRLFCVPALATTRYVRAGAAGASCSSYATDDPGHASPTWKAAIECTTAGDTVYVHAGTYTENLWSYQMTFPAGGSSYAAGQVITISAFPSEVVTLKGTIVIRGSDFANYSACPKYYIWQNFTILKNGAEDNNINIRTDHVPRNANHMKFINLELTMTPYANANSVGVLTGGASIAEGANSNSEDTYLEFTNCNIHGMRDTNGTFRLHGIYIGSSHNTFDGNVFHDNGGYGAQFNTDFTNPYMTGNVFKNNLIYGNGITQGGGVNFLHNDGAVVFNNVVYSNNASGIVVYLSKNCKIYNNTTYGNATDGIEIAAFGSQFNNSGNQVENNISKNNAAYGVHVNSGGLNTVVTFNDTHGNTIGTILDSGTTSTVSNNITTDPVFVANGSDFHIQTTSPCKNTGTDTSADVPTDKDGVTRPQGGTVDIGAYEFVITDVTAPTISLVTAISITDATATINWSTNELSDSQVEYGPTVGYGTSTSLDASLVTAHSVNLSGLTQNTFYHYRVKSKDAAINLATSGDFTFSTAVTPFTATIVLFSPDSAGRLATGTTYQIIWSSNDPGNLKIEYTYNNGATYAIVAASVAAAAGQYSWTVPPGSNNSARIKLTSLTYPSVSDTSSAAFTVNGFYVK